MTRESGNSIVHEITEIARLSAGLAASQARRIELPEIDPLNLKRPLVAATASLLRNPGRLMAAQWDLARRHLELVQYAAFRGFGLQARPVADSPRGDRRFRSEAWTERFIFDLLRQSYLLTADWLLETVAGIDDVAVEDRDRIRFYTRQFTDALSPSNYLLTNPEVLSTTRRERGANLLRGLRMLLEDLNEGDGKLLISLTDKSAFEVGGNIATTEGGVVYENAMMQLIQYAPTTRTVYQRPLLIIPPWINKYYILDLKPENSFIKWAVDRGYTVFVISWVNPDRSMRCKRFEDYMHEGIFEALDAIELATGRPDVNVIGYCIGGTLLAATLAYMKAWEDERIRSATFFAAQVDFTEAGDLKVFIDDKQLKCLEKKMASKGYMDGKDMAMTFNMLRANDLIWSFVINNYLLGQKPPTFDLLYWNSDYTRLPEAMHNFYLRKMYLENRLVEPGGIELDGVPINLSDIDLPVYIQSSREDHIAPYRSVYKAAGIYSGPVRFMLAGSGHIAGVINPPAAEKYGYWTNGELPDDVEEWIAGADYTPGSWWPDWHDWLKSRSGRRVSARVPGDRELEVIEAAPGRYVRAS